MARPRGSPRTGSSSATLVRWHATRPSHWAIAIPRRIRESGSVEVGWTQKNGSILDGTTGWKSMGFWDFGWDFGMGFQVDFKRTPLGINGWKLAKSHGIFGSIGSWDVATFGESGSSARSLEKVEFENEESGV